MRGQCSFLSTLAGNCTCECFAIKHGGFRGRSLRSAQEQLALAGAGNGGQWRLFKYKHCRGEN